MYVGRFAPSPSGPLHAGSVAVAMASYLDARAHQGLWLVRIEDIDTPRCVAGADQIILQQLQALGMLWDGEVWHQSQRNSAYQTAFESLLALGRVYPCGCTRREIADSVISLHGKYPEGERPYPGTCRDGLPQGREAKAWRFRIQDDPLCFSDRWMGRQRQDVAQQVGDFVIKRADGLWAYQLAVVIDDAAQGVTHIVRGEDLLSSTARQHLLATTLGHSKPIMMHVPLVTDQQGLKLSKQNGAPAIDTRQPLKVLLAAWSHLQFDPLQVRTIEQFWAEAIRLWQSRFKPD